MAEKKERTIFGVPIEKAREVLEYYKARHRMPTQDYIDGFEDGVKYTMELYESNIQKIAERWVTPNDRS